VIGNIRAFLDDVKIEMKKVTWPTMMQTKGSTVVVILTVIAIGIYFGVIDFFLSKLIHLFLG